MIAPPTQARSRRTLARIVEASRALIAERGRDGLTVQDVVARARTSVGSFYARFASREDLLRYLDEELTARSRDRWDAGLAERVAADAPLSLRVRAVVQLSVAHDDAATPEIELHRRTTAVRTLLQRRGEIRHPHPQAVVELGYAAMLGGVSGRPAGWDDESLIEELCRMWLGYLEMSGADAQPGGVDFFEVWA